MSTVKDLLELLDVVGEVVDKVLKHRQGRESEDVVPGAGRQPLRGRVVHLFWDYAATGDHPSPLVLVGG